MRNQLDNLLTLNGYPVFEGYTDYLKDEAMQHAEREYAAYIEIQKLKLLGVDVDIALFFEGEYLDYKEQTSQISRRGMNKMVEELNKNNNLESKESVK